MMRSTVAASVLLVACAASPVVVDGTPSDLAELVTATLETVEAALPAHVACLDQLVVDHAWELENRAEYLPDTSTIVLRVPATADKLEFSLVHEIAHHLEIRCPDQLPLRTPFLLAQGTPPDATWFDGPSWEETPSEQFATALAQVVTGRPDPQRHVRLTDEALALVELWAREGSEAIESSG